MPVELPNELIYFSGGAFLLGWILASISNRLSSKVRPKERDARDGRIRALEAELRIARSESDSSRTNLEKIEENLQESTVGLERRDIVISEQQAKLDRLSIDLKDSVLKTRQLRAELVDRATENLRAEAKIREVETELSLAQASTDLIATGILDYTYNPDDPDASEEAPPNTTSKGSS